MKAALRADLAQAGELRFECAIGRHHLIVVSDGAEATAAIVTAGKIAWQDKDSSWDILASGKGILGGDEPGLILDSYSGGAHCCTTLHALRLGRTVREMESIDLGDGVVELTRYRRRGRAVLEIADDVLRYWNTGFALSPFGSVYVVADGERWRPLPDLMRASCGKACDFRLDRHRKIRLDARTQRQLAEELAASHRKEGRPVPRLWDVMTRLVYAGRVAEAFEFLKASWPAELPDRDTFAAAYVAALSDSDYFEVLLGFDGETLLASLLTVAGETPSLLPRSGRRGDDWWGAWAVVRKPANGRIAISVTTCEWDMKDGPEVGSDGEVVFDAGGVVQRRNLAIPAKTDPAHAPCNR